LQKAGLEFPKTSKPLSREAEAPEKGPGAVEAVVQTRLSRPLSRTPCQRPCAAILEICFGIFSRSGRVCFGFDVDFLGIRARDSAAQSAHLERCASLPLSGQSEENGFGPRGTEGVCQGPPAEVIAGIPLIPLLAAVSIVDEPESNFVRLCTHSGGDEKGWAKNLLEEHCIIDSVDANS
jgi:hypothetical protein